MDEFFARSWTGSIAVKSFWQSTPMPAAQGRKLLRTGGHGLVRLNLHALFRIIRSLPCVASLGLRDFKSRLAKARCRGGFSAGLRFAIRQGRRLALLSERLAKKVHDFFCLQGPESGYAAGSVEIPS